MHWPVGTFKLKYVEVVYSHFIDTTKVLLITGSSVSGDTGLVEPLIFPRKLHKRPFFLFRLVIEQVVIS